jgi:fumarate hydratase class II
MGGEHREHDALGEVTVSDDVYYGAQTARARDNFPISRRGISPLLIHALGTIKAAAACANAYLGLLQAHPAAGIARAAEEVANGRHDDQFIVDVYQTGSGTSSNMNANEVIAKRANEILTGRRHADEPVHPNDHVNLGQSSNDVFPTAIHLAATRALTDNLLPSLGQLQDALARKEKEFETVMKIGRTHLQDAIPMRLGQEFAGYARLVERNRQRILEARDVLGEVPLGGTAVGTSLNAHPDFAGLALASINTRSMMSLRLAGNYFEAVSSRHGIVATSGALRTLATDLLKIANDVRLLSSGPRCGLGEITLPVLQPGSSMMPGKVNPVIPEAVCQVAARVIGNDGTIGVAGQSGLLELNVMVPVMADCLLESITLLGNVCRLFALRCVVGIVANRERCEKFVANSLALATALVPRLGHEAAARIARRAFETGQTVREAAATEPGLDSAQLDRLLDPQRMTHGGRMQN